MASSNQRNPFYFLLLAASMLFIATALAYGILPQMEDNAASVGPRPAQAPFRAALRTHGPRWLFFELAAMALFVVLSLGLDWWRSPRNAPPQEEAARP